MGFKSKEIFSKYVYKTLINQIRENYLMTKEEQLELNEFLKDISH